MLGVPRPVRILLLSLALGLAGGCARRVIVQSDPPGATVRTKRKMLGPTPYERRVWWVPFARQEVTVAMSGYRPVTVDLRPHLGLVRAETVHEVVLVPQHGPSGTWLPEDAEQ